MNGGFHLLEPTQLPIVESSATYLGLAAFPVVNDKIVTEYRVTGVFGSLDGRFFDRDIATVVHGRLPRLDSTTEVALSAPVGATVINVAVVMPGILPRRPAGR